MDTQAFFPANKQLPGDRDGGHDGDRGPPLVGTLFSASLAVVDEGHAPVVAVLVPAVKISLMDDIGPRRPCRASAKERQPPQAEEVKARLPLTARLERLSAGHGRRRSQSPSAESAPIRERATAGVSRPGA
jgi:hypothetical protein